MLTNVYLGLVIGFRLLALYLCGNAAFAIVTSLFVGANVKMVFLLSVSFAVGILIWKTSKYAARLVTGNLEP